MEHLFTANMFSPSVSDFPCPPLHALGTYLLPYSHPPHLGSRNKQLSPSLLPADTENLSGALVLLFSHSVMSDSLQPHGLRHARLPCITISQSLPKLMSIELVMPSSHLILCRPLLLPPSIFPASGSFQMSQLFTSGGQSIGVSASALFFQ